jgi:hypothetical protein
MVDCVWGFAGGGVKELPKTGINEIGRRVSEMMSSPHMVDKVSSTYSLPVAERRNQKDSERESPRCKCRVCLIVKVAVRTIDVNRARDVVRCSQSRTPKTLWQTTLGRAAKPGSGDVKCVDEM